MKEDRTKDFETEEMIENTEHTPEMIRETQSEQSEQKSVSSKPVKKLKGAKSLHARENNDVMSALDRQLVKQEEENRKANAIAAADPELHGDRGFVRRHQPNPGRRRVSAAGAGAASV